MNNDGAHVIMILLSKSEGAENLYTVPIDIKYDESDKTWKLNSNNSSIQSQLYLAYT